MMHPAKYWVCATGSKVLACDTLCVYPVIPDLDPTERMSGNDIFRDKNIGVGP